MSYEICIFVLLNLKIIYRILTPSRKATALFYNHKALWYGVLQYKVFRYRVLGYGVFDFGVFGFGVFGFGVFGFGVFG